MLSFFTHPQRRLFIIVVVLVLVVFAVVFPLLYSAQAKTTRDIQRIAAMRTLQAAIEQYMQKFAIAPSSAQSATDFVCVESKESGMSILYDQHLLSLLPELPRAGECIQYRSDGHEYKMRMQLENQQLNTLDKGGGAESSNWYEIGTVEARSW